MSQYQKHVKKLRSTKSKRKNPSLKSTKNSVNKLGNPEKDYEVVLVGGSNGKGSTTEMISELLSSQDKKVGIFKSPHLTDLRERIKINGNPIPQDSLVRQAKKLEKLETNLSFFESLTVIAYSYFSDEKVDYAIMEVGMGGRLDATNAANPEVSVITNVSKEHTQYLGEEKEKIAEEIAGITPENGYLITREDSEPVKEKAEKRNTEILTPVNVSKKDGRYRFKDQKFTIPLEGSYQKENLENALRTVEILEKIPEDLGKSLENLKCPGRLEKLGENPQIILDGAHNPPAVKKALKDLPEDFICVFGCTETKNSEKMIKLLERKASEFKLTKPDLSWAERPEKLKSYSDIKSKSFKDNKKAVQKAVKQGEKSGKPVVITGSLYLIGNLKQKIERF